MPTYEYRCPEGHDFEDFVLKMSDARSELPCPTCGKVAARRMSAGSGLLFKGSGFYITDYGKDGKKDQRTAAAKAESASKANESSSSATSAPKSDAKPAAAAAPAAASTTPKSGPAK
jgi:putative FmdB family regulatory protein